MANQQHLNRLMQGVEAWNKWREKYLDLEPDLSYAPLSGKRLQKINFFKANLRGVELSGADLRGADFIQANLQEANLSEANLSRANFNNSNLQEAYLIQTNLQGAHLYGAVLKGAHLVQASLREAVLDKANLQGTDLNEADLRGAEFNDANLQGADLSGADLKGAHLIHANAQGTVFNNANLQDANLSEADLKGASLIQTNLQGSHLDEADLRGAELNDAKLQGADLSGADLKGASLIQISLQGADLRRAFFDTATRLDGVILGDKQNGIVFLADVNWGEVNLSLVDWALVKTLGDERQARQASTINGKKKDNDVRLKEYRAAIRANRQLASALRDQGMNEEATPFAYQSQALQRRLLLQQVLQHHKWPPTKRHLKLGLALLIITLLLLLILGIVSLKYSSSSFIAFGQMVAWPSLLLDILLPISGLLMIYVLPMLLQLESRNEKEDIALSLLILLILLIAPLILIIIPLVYLLSNFLELMSHVPIMIGLLLVTVLLLIYRTYLQALLLRVPHPSLQLWVALQPLFRRLQTLPLLMITQKFMHSSLSLLHMLFKALPDYGRYTTSLFLDMLAGYGYKPVRSLFWYLFVLLGFTTIYFSFNKLPLPVAFFLSLTSFHGRGFFPGPTGKSQITDTTVFLAAIEAVVGLFIEISFIATFTQRFFGK